MLKVLVTQLCPTLCDLMDYTVHGILQARILEGVAISFSAQETNIKGLPLTRRAHRNCAWFPSSLQTKDAAHLSASVLCFTWNTKVRTVLPSVYFQLSDTHHNREAVVTRPGCWSSVFCIELNIPDLGHKTDWVCKTLLSGEPASLQPERHSSFHPVSIRDVYQAFLEVNSHYSSYLA